MYNLYSITTNQSAIIALLRAVHHNVGNLPPMPGVLTRWLFSSGVTDNVSAARLPLQHTPRIADRDAKGRPEQACNGSDACHFHCFSSFTQKDPGNMPGFANALTTLANIREQLLSKLFAGSAGP